MNGFWRFGFLALFLSVSAQAPVALDMEKLRDMMAQDPYDLISLQEFAKGVGAESDPNLQAHYLTVCYVGFLAHGEGEMAKKAYETLKEVHPGSLYVERLAPLKFMKNCPDCRRALDTSVACPVCSGSNVCTACKGRRTIEGLSNKKRPCPRCNGTGQCSSCNRRGRVPTVCVTCGGSRQVPDREKMFLVYKRLLQAEGDAVRKGRWVRVWQDAGEGEEPAVPEAIP